MYQLKRKHAMTRPGPQPNEYLLGHSANEEERLRRQPQELAPDSKRLLDQLDIRPGGRAIDIGCGPQGILDLLSERVGARGRVVGLERSESTVHLARQFIAEHDLRNVEVLQGDAKATGLPKASFDVVHARLVLVNVPDPQRVVEEMVDLARPGGVVASHEADWGAFLCDPPSPAWDRLSEVFEAYSRKNGIDLFVGRKTHQMFRAAGLIDIQVNAVIHVYPPGHNRRNILRDFLENVKDRILAENLMTETEFHERLTELQRHLDDPGALVISHLFLQVWGRKPGKTCVPERSA
jgi:ubiquinone/menaquinone biosynthesis C-methylase UbiE